MPKAEEKISPRKEYGDAILKMVNVLFDPLNVETIKELGLQDEANLLGLTRLHSRREAFHWSMVITKEAGKKKLVALTGDSKIDNNNRHWSLSKIRRVSFWLACRSVDMRAFGMGVGLAGKQSLGEEEREDSERGWEA